MLIHPTRQTVLQWPQKKPENKQWTTRKTLRESKLNFPFTGSFVRNYNFGRNFLLDNFPAIAERGRDSRKTTQRKGKKMKTERIARFFEAMSRLGFSFDEANKLRRIEMTLSRWGELCCGNENGCISRDDETGKPYWQSSWDNHSKTPVADREAGALKRLAKIMAEHPELVAYHQTDPRGCSLYVVRKSEVNGCPLDQCYTRGFGVCY